MCDDDDDVSVWYVATAIVIPTTIVIIITRVVAKYTISRNRCCNTDRDCNNYYNSGYNIKKWHPLM